MAELRRERAELRSALMDLCGKMRKQHEAEIAVRRLQELHEREMRAGTRLH